MRIDIFHHIELTAEVAARFDAMSIKQDLIISNEDKIMATLADVVASDAQMKTELDTIAADVTTMVAANAQLATDLAAAVASNDPVALQAAADQAAANAAAGQAIIAKFP